MNTDQVSQTVRAIRAKLHISQEELAAKLGVSFATVNRWEGGVNKPQKSQWTALQILADAAKVTPKDLKSSAQDVVKTRSRLDRRGKLKPGLERAIRIIDSELGKNPKVDREAGFTRQVIEELKYLRTLLVYERDIGSTFVDKD